MARYRRTSLSDRDRLAASAVSLLVGTGAALVSYYLTRLLLSREELPGYRSDTDGAAALEESSRRALGAGGGAAKGAERASPSGRSS